MVRYVTSLPNSADLTLIKCWPLAFDTHIIQKRVPTQNSLLAETWALGNFLWTYKETKLLRFPIAAGRPPLRFAPFNLLCMDGISTNSFNCEALNCANQRSREGNLSEYSDTSNISEMRSPTMGCSSTEVLSRATVWQAEDFSYDPYSRGAYSWSGFHRQSIGCRNFDQVGTWFQLGDNQ